MFPCFAPQRPCSVIPLLFSLCRRFDLCVVVHFCQHGFPFLCACRKANRMFRAVGVSEIHLSPSNPGSPPYGRPGLLNWKKQGREAGRLNPVCTYPCTKGAQTQISLHNSFNLDQGITMLHSVHPPKNVKWVVFLLKMELQNIIRQTCLVGHFKNQPSF